ncbi:hypothetical protein BIWAKO_04600 [Bosea sp. BIWAKO-01]|nr:hypothetical protein BIWAKO_04600 [Bosea sp. BIWAKO-01]
MLAAAATNPRRYASLHERPHEGRMQHWPFCSAQLTLSLAHALLTAA